MRPERGWFKINTDGSSIGNPEKAGGGGVLRADNGAWIKAYSRNTGHTTSLLAELWAIRDGLSMCIDLGINALIVKSDATNASLVADCRLLLSQIPQVKVLHCFREANCCVDALARIGTYQIQICCFITPLPLCF